MSIIIKLKKYINIFVTTLWIIQIYIYEKVGKSCITYKNREYWYVNKNKNVDVSIKNERIT